MFENGIPQFPTEEELERLKSAYPIGTRLKLIHMADPYPVPAGTEGSVVHIDDMGQIQMKWDNGSTLAIFPKADTFVIVKDGVIE